MEVAAILLRWLQYAGAAAVGGSALFFLYAGRPAPGERWPSALVRAGAATGLVGVAGWLVAKAADITGSMAPDQVWALASGAGFGRAALARLGFFALALGLAIPRRNPPWTPMAIAGLAAAGSFAWSGHGASDEGAAGLAHLCADALHAMAAAIWIGALLALAPRLAAARRQATATAAQAALAGLEAFSRIGVWVVGLLIATGIVNGWFLVGPAGVARMADDPYGQLLLGKLALVAGMLGLAAANRYAISPALARGLGARPLGAATASVTIETLFGLAVLGLTAWLGNLPPIAHG